MQVVIGRIGRAHGIRGEVSIDVRTDEPQRRFAVGSSLRSDAGVLTIRSVRPHSGRLLVTFDEIRDRTAAEGLRGVILTTDVSPDETLDDPEEFFDHQLVGLEARTADGVRIGAVTEVLHLPAQDTLAIATDAGGEVLVPFVLALVPAVDVAGGFLTVVDLPGLLDPEAADTAEPPR